MLLKQSLHIASVAVGLAIAFGLWWTDVDPMALVYSGLVSAIVVGVLHVSIGRFDGGFRHRVRTWFDGEYRYLESYQIRIVLFFSWRCF